MAEIETDYLVVGAGASGMSFVDSLIAESDAEVVMVDRRHRPGGHWRDAYPFVRLHQPAANYGVCSRKLGEDRIDESGPNAGFYEQATAAEICDYYDRVLDEHLLPSGQVRFLGMRDYRGPDTDGHQLVSCVTGETTTVKVRRKLVDATYQESTVPSRHTPAFSIDPDVRFLTPNELVHLEAPATGYTVLGAGKTAMDTCCWLLDQGVDPDSIRWVRPRDPWVMDRSFTQPLSMVGSLLEARSHWVQAAAEADDAVDMAHRMEATGVFRRLDPGVEPEVFRGATLSATEMEALRQVERVVRLGKVRRVGTDSVDMDEGTISSDPGEIYVDCTAPGLGLRPVRPVFEPDGIVMQTTTFGIVPWSAALIGYLEASRPDDTDDKNRLGPAVELTGELSSLVPAFGTILTAEGARMAEPDVMAWNESCRLNPGRGASEHLDEPRVQAAFARMGEHLAPAMANLERLRGTLSAA